MRKTPKLPANQLKESQFLKGQKNSYPWDDANEKVIVTFNLRLPEPLHKKLVYISDHTPGSRHQFIMDVLEPAIEAEIERLTEIPPAERRYSDEYYRVKAELDRLTQEDNRKGQS